MFVYVWEYEVRPERVAEFEIAYGADGSWVRLFQRDPAYLGTELLRDAANPLRFVTIDRWRTKADRDRFRVENANAYERLDQSCGGFTTGEKHVGDFETVADRT